MEAKNYFKKLEPWSQLKIRAVRGGAVTVMTNALAFGIQMIGTIVLARLLTPRDFGLVAMVTTFSLFLQTFVTGFTESTIQRETISHSQLSNLFWINLAVSGSCTVVVAALAPVLAWFYGDRERAAILCEESLQLWKEQGDSWGAANALEFLGLALSMEAGLLYAAGRYYFPRADHRPKKHIGARRW